MKKGIALGSGLGGSAASSVAAVFALNQFLKEPLTNEQLAAFALEGESVATNTIHSDNVIPCLYGGLTLIHSLKPLKVITLPDMKLVGVFIRPHIAINTRDARACLKPHIPLSTFVKQNANTAAFISALYCNDFQLLKDSCFDLVVEPMRQHLIPYFHEVQAIALNQGALACSISGAGPTTFALCRSTSCVEKIANAMYGLYESHGIDADKIISPISNKGVRVIK